MSKAKSRLTVILAFATILFLFACTSKSGGNGEPQAAAAETAGRATLTPEAAKTAGIQTEAAQVRTISPSIKASGTVTLNQKKYVRVTPRVAGRIEKVFVFEGDRVRPGQELFSLYSPDLLAAQAEYLQVLARAPAGGKSAATDDEKLHEGLLKSTEERLRLLGFEESDLASLRTNRQSMPVLSIRAPIAGTIIESETAAGSAVELGTCLAAIADLSSLWVDVHIFEKDLASVVPGSRAEIAVAAYPGELFPGTLELVGSLMDQVTRTVKGRIAVANAAAKLKPGMFADVKIISRDAVTILAVPESAVRAINGKPVVFVPAADGAFVRRDIEKGRTIDGFVEILRGLKEGERVVTAGSFDVKAEMLKGALEGER